MRLLRVIAILVGFIAIGAIVALAIGRATGAAPSGYVVRAVFDNSSFVIPGEDVKVSGVKVGTIQGVGLTPQNQAVLVLAITNQAFEPFRKDAHCAIGLESLLGEQFVQCTPTQPRLPGAPVPPPIPAIATGPDKGQHLLPVQDTTAPVGQDLIADITRLPQQERLRLVISGLGAGLAGNGQELNAALLRADPALQETDAVIGVLAAQDKVIAQLTDESSAILAPLAVQRAHIGGFVRHGGEVAAAAAQQGNAIEQNLADFPPFLRQLQPAAVRLTNLAEQITPALQTLQPQTPAINASLTGLGPLTKSSIPTVRSLGDFARRGTTVFPRIQPVVEQLLHLGTPLVPLTSDLAALATSFDNAGGIEDVMRFIYYYTGSVNGEDAVGHYIRSMLEITTLTRTSALNESASARFSCTTGAASCATAATARVGQRSRRATAARAASRPRPDATARGHRGLHRAAGQRAGGHPRTHAPASPRASSNTGAGVGDSFTSSVQTLLSYLLRP